MVCTVVIIVTARLQPLQGLVLRNRTSTANPDALIAAAVVFPIALALYARRRYREAIEVREELVRFSLHDALTGLPNRRLLFSWLTDDISRAQGRSGQAAVLFVDLDRFKHVNDTHGHEVGDRLMVAVAKRLVDVVADQGRVLRFGGDEFVILAAEVTPVSARRLAELVVRVVERPFTVGNESLRISASIGIALAEKEGVAPQDLIHDADAAMFQAKSAGTGQVVVYDRSMAGSLTPAGAEHLIRKALDDGDLHLYYQPVVDLASGRIVGAEALLRWIDEERGTMAPSQFIPVLEETGLIVPVGTWVLQEACRQVAVISQLLPDVPPMTITINVSPRQIAQLNFVDTVVNAVADAGIDPAQIHLEITEVALLRDVGSAWTTLRQVKAHGVKLALDDFGTGYSSLSYVRRFSLDMLKIDKSFVDGIDSASEDRAIVEHVIGMAHALGMSTVGEGVERTEQIAALRALGCRMAQGYVFARPLPAGDFERLLLQRVDEPFAVDTNTHRDDLPVTDPSAQTGTDPASPDLGPVIELTPPRKARVWRPRVPTEEPSDVDRLVVPPGMLESADDRRATVTPILSRPAPKAPVPPVVEDDEDELDDEPTAVGEAPKAGPLLPRIREYRRESAEG
ncbi:MAG: bifunctional diguanylate cyclase/phosphodiesterase [Actinobacteria bacterium]|nr:bifunctional diguanylate cyclase/phosphodiesterase [Actinomycetota bacterium]